ncbi:glycosyltransferase family 39 protein, partial [bacterium]|nr:glycosyltransferase family 39 protein [bacterium]
MSRPADRGGPGERGAAGALLLLFALLAVLSMRAKTFTFDETAHLAAGISYVKTGDFRMNPEHPALPKLLAGAAAAAAGADVRPEGKAWETGEQWDFARETLYGGDASWKRILFAGRLPMVLLGVLLGAVLWTWMRAMTGPGGAFVALALYAFSPTVLAHTRLVTTDVPLTLFVVATAAALWQAWRTGKAGWIAAAALGVALSMVTKFSAFSYAPAWALLAVLPGERRPLRTGLAHLGVLVLLSAVLTELLVFACYGFATDFVTIRTLGMAGRGVDPGSMSMLRRIPYEIMASIPWPSAEFARGMKDVILYTEGGHPVYALGMRADRGWWWQPFLALGVKPSLPFLLLAAGGALALLRSRLLFRRESLFLIAPAALVLATNVAANLGLGVRHLLPMFPFLMGLAAWPFAASATIPPARAGIAALLLLWHAVGTLVAHPHYLSYFNEPARLAGGGFRLLGDSNLDWGQDLSIAADRLRELGASSAILCYFGTASPFVEGIEWQILPPAPRAKNLDPWKVLPAEGPQWLVMSATNRQGIYYRATGGEAPYPWLDDVPPDEVIGGGSMFLYEISGNADVQRGLAAAYVRHGLGAEAEGALRRVLARTPHDGTSRATLVDMLLARGDRLAADEVMDASPNPDERMVLLLIANKEQIGVAFPELLELYERALVVFPNSGDARNAYAWFLQKHDLQLDQALRLADQAVEWAPDDVYYRDTRGMVHLRRLESEAALADFDHALSLPGGDLAEIHWHRILALRDAGRRSEAVRAARV